MNKIFVNNQPIGFLESKTEIVQHSIQKNNSFLELKSGSPGNNFHVGQVISVSDHKHLVIHDKASGGLSCVDVDKGTLFLFLLKKVLWKDKIGIIIYPENALKTLNNFIDNAPKV